MNQLDFIGAFLQTKAKYGVFVKLNSRYADCFSEYSNYFGIALILFKSVHVMNNSGKLFAGELTEWLLEAGFIQSQFQIYIYYKYAPDGTKIVFKYYVYYCVYWYTSEAIGK